MFREIITTLNKLKKEIESKLKPDDIFESLCKLYDKGTLTEIEREKLQQHFDLIYVNSSPKESLNVKEIEEEIKLSTKNSRLRENGIQLNEFLKVVLTKFDCFHLKI